jgi:peptidoglycan/xylan/chitin deacetylase (PgdA/CDA1 family)
MKLPFTANSITQTPVPAYDRTAGRLLRTKTRVLKAYADLRVGATTAEKHAYHPGDAVVLTFDDYGTPEQVARILDILLNRNVRAMFFLQGDWADEHPELVEKIAAGGHIIGNHTYSHVDLTALSDKAVREEIAGGPAGAWLRPPRGRYNQRVRAIAASLGYRICYWTVDSDDWQGVTPSYIRRNVLSGLHPGAVILFHLHADHTAAALPELINAIRERGFELDAPTNPRWEPGV